MNQVPEPLNTTEKYLYGMVMRLDALCHMMNSLIEHIASKENVAVEQNTVKETPPKPRRKSG